MRSISLELPYPPSVNRMWRSVLIGRVPRVLLSKEGREYKEIAKRVIGHLKPFAGDLTVLIESYPPDKRKRDIDNLPKCVFDAITYAGVWADDNQVADFRVKRMPPYEGGKLIVTIQEQGDER